MELDQETRHDLMEAFVDLHREAEHAITALPTTTDPELKHALFRAIHNMKGNAGMMQLEKIVAFTHELEELVSALRQERLTLSEDISELMLIGLDRLHDLHQAELFNRDLDSKPVIFLQTCFAKMADASQQNADALANKSLEALTHGFEEQPTELATKPETPPPTEASSEQALKDLVFFQEMSLELDARNPHWQGRSGQLFAWAMQINQLTCSPVDQDQLAAGIYMHDFGMNLVEKEFWERDVRSGPEPDSALYKHPQWSYELLSRMPDWQEAATIALQHHELLDGSGFPAQLKADEIHQGAKILAILDSFFHLTQGPVNASNRQSTARALSAINARAGVYFDEELVQCFNYILRCELRAGNV